MWKLAHKCFGASNGEIQEIRNKLGPAVPTRKSTKLDTDEHWIQCREEAIGKLRSQQAIEAVGMIIRLRRSHFRDFVGVKKEMSSASDEGWFPVSLSKDLQSQSAVPSWRFSAQASVAARRPEAKRSTPSYSTRTSRQSSI